MINVTGREFVWDDVLFDSSKTNAERRLHQPVRKEDSMVFDKPWEGNGCGYFHIVYDDVKNIYRMYYLSFNMYNPDGSLYKLSDVNVCCLESKDCINWERPNLNIYSYKGNRNNNIIINTDMFEGLMGIDNFYVNVDTNPKPKVKGKYKAVMLYTIRNLKGPNFRKLASLVSDDGYNFKLHGIVTESGYFDTLNTFMYHKETKKYYCYIRAFHDKETGKDYDRNSSIPVNSYVRDIRVLQSEDFIKWTEPQRLNFNSKNDYPLYTNCISIYPNSSMFVGFPTRYVERKEWTQNFDELCGKEERLSRMKLDNRFGLATTDCLFMCSRDGVKWYRYDEAFLRPGVEHDGNWVYGSCYPSVGFNNGDELYMFAHDYHWIHHPTVMYRMALRKDGFVSLHAGIAKKKAITKQFKFTGSEMHINFSTSAYGNVYITIRTKDGKELKSCELFGDSIDRRVPFTRNLADFSGKIVTMEIELCDADIYSFEFT
ncbi:MAG: hypothetical protein MJ236_05205 [Clostridia bacterium]|nr:hypothetical protein [Clostridia bacterium]